MIIAHKFNSLAYPEREDFTVGRVILDIPGTPGVRISYTLKADATVACWFGDPGSYGGGACSAVLPDGTVLFSGSDDVGNRTSRYMRCLEGTVLTCNTWGDYGVARWVMLGALNVVVKNDAGIALVEKQAYSERLVYNVYNAQGALLGKYTMVA